MSTQLSRAYNEEALELALRLRLTGNMSVITCDMEGCASIQFTSKEQLLEWFDGIVTESYNAGVEFNKANALKDQQQNARELFKNVFGVELK
jgi:hypothetical protein